LAVHPELQEAYKKAKCHDGAAGCCCDRDQKLKDNACPNFVGCGPSVQCGVPCRHCIAWEGYGGEEVVAAVKVAVSLCVSESGP
jgi:hypothetical protein